MLVIDKKLFKFLKVKEIYFSNEPFDVKDCQVVSFFGCRNKVDASGFTRTGHLTAINDLTEDLDTIFKKFHRHCRHKIRVAEREVIEIRVNKDFEEFYNIYTSLLHRKRIAPLFEISPVYPEVMKKYGTLFTARSQGRILGGHLYLEDSSNIRGWLFASRRLEVNHEEAKLIANVNSLLHWEAIKYAKQKGIKEFDWCGLGTEDEVNEDISKYNINRWKLSFGCTPTIRYNYWKPYSKVYKHAKDSFKLLSHYIGIGY